MGMLNEKHSQNQFAEKMFDTILYYARENDKAFKENISNDYHATLLVTFFMIYGIDLVNFFVLNKYGKFNKQISTKLFSLMSEKIDQSFPADEAEMIKDCVSVMEDEIIKALAMPFEEGLKNPFYKLALYIPTIIDIRDNYNKLHANQLLFNCLGQTFAGIGKLVDEQEIVKESHVNIQI